MHSEFAGNLLPFHSLDELSNASWDYVEKYKLKEKIRCNPKHLQFWKIDRAIAEYEKTLCFELQNHISEKAKDNKEKYIILDIGCGGGWFLKEASRIDGNVAGYGITNIFFEGHYEKSKTIIGNIGETYYNPLSHKFSLPKLPYVLPHIANNSIDLAVSVYALQYLKPEDIIKSIEQTRRILKPNGLALLHVDTTSMNEKEIILQYLNAQNSSSSQIKSFEPSWQLMKHNHIVKIEKN